MSISPTMSQDRGLLCPALLLLPLLIATALAPAGLASALICVGLLVFGLRYPVVTTAVALVIIPILDQAVAEDEFTEIFGAFRLTPAVALKAMMSFVVISYLWRHRINPLRYRILQPLLIWLAYAGCTCFVFHDRALALSMWMRLAYWVTYFVFFFVVAAREQNSASSHIPAQITRLWRAGLFALAVFAGSVFLAKIMRVGGDYYGVGESYGFYADPWNMAMTLPGLLALALLYPWVLAETFRNRHRWIKIACMALAGAAVLASFLTYTRTSLIACFFCGIAFTFALKRVIVSKETRLMFALALVMVSGAVFIVYRNMTSRNSGNQVAARWSEVDKGDIGSGRLEVFYAAWTKFMNASPARKLIGHGIGAGPEAAEEFMGVYVYLHDDLLEMLVCAGVVGLALYCWFFARFYRAVIAGFHDGNIWAVAALVALATYNVTAISYMRIYAVTPNTYFALVAGTSLGMLQTSRSAQSETTN